MSDSDRVVTRREATVILARPLRPGKVDPTNRRRVATVETSVVADATNCRYKSLTVA